MVSLIRLLVTGLLLSPALVAAQFLIIALYTRMVRGIASGKTRPRPRLGRFLLLFGGVYFAFMATRLMLGATVLSHSTVSMAP